MSILEQILGAFDDRSPQSLLAIVPEPSPALRPAGSLFLVLVSWVWPIYFLSRAAVGAFLGGLVKDGPFKLAAVGLLWVLLHRLRHNAGALSTSDPGFCEQYVHAEFEFFSLFIFGFVLIGWSIRYTDLRQRLAQLVHRASWPAWARAVDGVAAVGLTAVSAPWFLAAVIQLLWLPPSPVVASALRTSDLVVKIPTIGYTYGHLLGGGKSFIETFTENLNLAFTGNSGTLACGATPYEGRWLAAMGLAVVLVPVAIGLTCDWFSSEAKWRSIVRFGIPERAKVRMGQFDTAHGSSDPENGRLSPAIRCRATGLFRVGFFLFVGWFLLSVAVFVVRIATGV